MKLINLGWTVAKLEFKSKKLTIFSPSDNTDGYHEPAQSINIHGSENLIALRDALIECFPIDETEELK